MTQPTIETPETEISEWRPRSAAPPVGSVGDRARSRSWEILAMLALLAILSLAACGADGGQVASPVTEEQAMEMAENALAAFNTGDYVAWSRDWSETMRGAIDQDDFLAFREQFRGALGDYVSISEAAGRPGDATGTYRWTFDVSFEEGEYRMWFGFKEGSPLIEGVSFEDPSA